MRAKSLQSCLTLWDTMDCRPSVSSVHGVFQARILEWVAISFSRGSSWPRDHTQISCLVGIFCTTEPQGKPNWCKFLDKKEPRDFPSGPVAKNLPCNAGDMGLIPGLGRSHMPWGNEAHVPQLLKPTSLEPKSHKRSRSNEKPPLNTTRESPCVAVKT